MTLHTASPVSPSANRSAPVWCSGPQNHAASSSALTSPCPMQGKRRLCSPEWGCAIKPRQLFFSCQEMPKCINNTEGRSVLIQSAFSCAEFSAITCQSAPPPEPPTQKHIFLNPLTRSATTCVKEYAQCVPNMSDWNIESRFWKKGLRLGKVVVFTF